MKRVLYSLSAIMIVGMMSSAFKPAETAVEDQIEWLSLYRPEKS